MKKIFFYLTAMLIVCGTPQIYAQSIKVPQLSSTQTIEQELGLGKVTLTYSRPNIKGRKIFGSIVPYGEVWRTGANAATIIKFTDDVTIESTDGTTIATFKVPAGEYGLFSIPNKDKWTIILNKTAHQWGAYSYKESEDVSRFVIKAAKLTDPIETFTMQFNDVEKNQCELALKWENVSVSFHISTDVDTKVMTNIDEVMNGDKKPYFEAAAYYYENDKDMKKALEWISIAEKTEPKSPFYKVWKARIQLKLGDKAGAISTAKEGVKLAKDQHDKEYEYLNQVIVDQTKYRY